MKIQRSTPTKEEYSGLENALFKIENMLNDQTLIPVLKEQAPEQCNEFLEAIFRAYQAIVLVLQNNKNSDHSMESIEPKFTVTLETLQSDIESAFENNSKVWKAIDALIILQRDLINQKGSEYLRESLKAIDAIETSIPELQPEEVKNG